MHGTLASRVFQVKKVDRVLTVDNGYSRKL